MKVTPYPTPKRKQLNMKKIVIIDNYDSFTYNLVHLLKELGGRTFA